MLVVETIAKIRRAYFAQKKSIKAICRELRVSRKVVRRVVVRYGALAREQAVQLEEMLATLRRGVRGGVELLPTPEAEEETSALVRRAEAPRRLIGPLLERLEERGLTELYRTIELPLTAVL